VTVGITLDIQIHFRLRVRQRGTAVHVNGVLSNCERLERRVPRPRRVLCAFGRPTGAKCVGQLLDSKNSLTAVSAALVRADASQQAEIVFLHRLLSAAFFEFTLSAMSIQYKIGRSLAGEQRCHLGYYLSHLAVELGGTHFRSNAVVTVNDLAESYFSIQR